MIVDDATYLRRLLAANDVTQAAQAAVDHVVESLGCEVSWMGVTRGEYLVIAASCGLQTPEMQSTWRLRIGEGIGGLVAAGGRPRMSGDYQHDSRRVPMKRQIDNEGINAVLVVPVLVAEQTLGVLYGARRVPYAWQEAEQARLTGIAQDLAVRLRQLDVDGTVARAAEAETRRADAAVEGLRSTAALADAYLSGNDLNAAVDALAAHLRAFVELRHADGTRIHAGGRVGEGASRSEVWEEIEGTNGLVLSVISAAPPEQTRAALADVAARLFQLQVLRLVERELTTEQLKGELLDQLLTGRIPDAAAVERRLGLLGFNIRHGAQVVVVGGRTGEGEAPAKLLAELEATFPGCVTVVREGRLVVLVDLATRSPKRVLDDLRDLLARGGRGGQVAGVGRPCAGPFEVSMSYDEARAACELALGDRGAHPSPVSARDLGIQGLASMPLAQLEATVLDTLGPLLRSDATRGTDLVDTVRVYLGNDRHLPDTAAQLRVHYNTVRNRISRAEEMLGIDFDDVDDRFRVETALRMSAVARARSAAPDAANGAATRSLAPR